MTVIEPTDKQVFDSLRKCKGCAWLGGQRCHCYSRCLQACFLDEKKALTKHIYSEAEIREAREENAKAMEELDKALDAYFS